MPLVLESLHAFDAPSRAAASGLLLTVVRCTHPRGAAHAASLWPHLLSAFCREAPEATRPIDELVSLIAASASPTSSVTASSGSPPVRIPHQKSNEEPQPGSSGDAFGWQDGAAAREPTSQPKEVVEELPHQDLVILNVLTVCRILAALSSPNISSGKTLPFWEATDRVGALGVSASWGSGEHGRYLEHFIKDACRGADSGLLNV